MRRRSRLPGRRPNRSRVPKRRGYNLDWHFDLYAPEHINSMLAVCRALGGVQPHIACPLTKVLTVQGILDAEFVWGQRNPPLEGDSGWLLTPADRVMIHHHELEAMHLIRVFESRPDIARFLGLPPGWRFETCEWGVHVEFSSKVLRDDAAV